MSDKSGILWIVATPIGTLADLGRRAEEVLERVDLLLAEDTRRTGRLLSALGIETRGRMRSLHEHNEARVLPAVLETLQSGKDAAIVSDAGTPVLSDPGFLVVRQARELGLTVASVPGPSAFTAALAASGQPPLPATLVGFLPPRGGARKRKLELFAGTPGSLVLFLSPHRLASELLTVGEVFGEKRPATLLAELSKRHERAEVGTLGELATGKEVDFPRGEYVLVVGPEIVEVPDNPSPEEARRRYHEALERIGQRNDALRSVARDLGMSKRDLYSFLLENGGF